MQEKCIFIQNLHKKIPTFIPRFFGFQRPEAIWNDFLEKIKKPQTHLNSGFLRPFKIVIKMRMRGLEPL